MTEPEAAPPATLRRLGRLPARRRADAAALIAIALLTAVFFWRPIFAGMPLSAADILYQSPPWQSLQSTAPILPGGRLWNRLMSDNIYGYYPEEVTAVRFLRQGILPLWDPYVFSGTPLLAESQRGVFYPPNIIVRLWPGEWAFSYGVIVHFLIGGWLMYALLRYFGLSPGPAAIGGLAFEFSGWMVSWVLTPYGIYTMVWLPLMILCYDRALRAGSARWAAATGLTISLQILAGQIQFVSYNLIALAAYGAVQTLVALRAGTVADGGGRVEPTTRAADTGRRDDGGAPPHPRPLTRREGGEGHPLLSGEGQEGRFLPAGEGRDPGPSSSTPGSRLPTPCSPAWTGALAVGIGLVVGAVQLLPTFEILALTGRAVRSYEDMLSHDLMPFPHLFSALVPYIFGSFPDENYTGWLNMLEAPFYFGLGTVLLAGIALFRQRRPETFAFALIALLPLLVLLFPAVFSLFYLAVPGFKQTFPSRLLYLTAFGGAALAGFGAAAFLQAVRDRRRWVPRLSLGLLLTWVALAVIVLVAPYFTAVRPAAFARFGWLPELPYSGYQLAQVSIAIALLGLLTAVVFLIGRRIVPVRAGSALLAGAIVIDLFAFGINYNPAFPPEALYPVTPAIAYLQERPEKSRFAAGDGVILPPNAGGVYGLEDVRGYTSLYSARYQNVISATQGDLPVYPLMEDGRANRNHLLAIGRTDNPLFRALNARYLVERRSNLPIRSIRNWADAITVTSDVDDALRPRVRNVGRTFDRVLFAHPPTSIVYHLPSLPEQAQLGLTFGIDPAAWYQRGDGVTFEVFAQRPGGTPRLIYSRYLDAKSNAADRAWFEDLVDLSGYEGGPVEITLRTGMGPGGDSWFDWGLWGDPEIVFGFPLAVELAAGLPAGGSPRRVEIDGVTHQIVPLNGTTTARATARVSDRGRLTLAVAALTPNLDWAEDPADLTLTVDGVTVLSQRFDPALRADQRHWSRVSVDLAAWAGREVEIGLRATAPAGTMLAIGDPRLVDERLDPGWELVFNEEVAVYQNDRAVDRAFLVARAIRAGSAADALAAVTRPDFDPRDTVVIENAAEAPNATGEPGQAEIRSYGPNEVEIATRSSSPNYLVLADQMYPGWQAFVDGVPATIYQANYIVRAVAVPAGDHSVKFVYRPGALLAGAAISAAGLLAALICLLARRPRLRRRTARIGVTP